MTRRNILALVATMIVTTVMAQKENFTDMLRQSMPRAMMTGKVASIAPAKNISRVTSPNGLITSQPSGKLYKNMYRNSKGFYVYFEVPMSIASNGYIDDFIEGEDGAFYLKNPYSTLFTKSWLKGERGRGDTIVFKLPQEIYTQYNPQTGQTESFYAQSMKEEGSLYVVDGKNEVKFVWRNDTLAKTNSDVLLGLTTVDGAWTGYGDTDIEMYPVGETATTPGQPETAETYLMEYPTEFETTDYAVVDVVREDDSLYIKGLDKNIDGGWIRGKMEGDKTVFTRQYMGVDTTTAIHVFYYPAKVTGKPNSYGTTDYTYEWADATTFVTDNASNGMVTKDGALINKGREKVEKLYGYISARLTPYEETAATPSNPKIYLFNDYNEESGYGGLMFTLPVTDTNNKVMNPDKLYYRLYIDGEVYTFAKDLYVNLPMDKMTDIPYNFFDDYDFQSQSTTRIVFFFVSDYKSIGVQSVYKGGGEEHVSDIVFADGTQSIHSTDSADTKREQKVTYTNLSGRIVTAPTKGVYIKSATYADGTVKTSKIIKK